jgi:hypothetical protein
MPWRSQILMIRWARAALNPPRGVHASAARGSHRPSAAATDGTGIRKKRRFAAARFPTCRLRCFVYLPPLGDAWGKGGMLSATQRTS